MHAFILSDVRMKVCFFLSNGFNKVTEDGGCFLSIDKVL